MLSPRAVLSIGALLWFGAAPAVFADSPTPQPVVTAPAVVAPVPTAPAPVAPVPQAPPPTTLPVAPEPTVAADTGAPVVSHDTQPIQQATQPAAVEPAPVPTQAQASEPSVLVQPTATAATGQQSATTQQTLPATPGITLPPTPGSAGASPVDSAASAVVDVNMQPVSAAAPAQLQCTGKSRPVATPFLSSPFAGWSEINSFVDHDLPDYSVDGKIILANGMTALASAGQESDFFPAYWSPDLRQYVNYDGHNGYDFGISYQPVLAAAAGTVEYAGWNSPDPSAGYGQMVLINHHNGYVTLYGHLSQLQVTTGDKVTAGEQIGISGTTGNSSGPHLHFSVFHNCQVTDPYGWTGSGPDPLKSFDGETSAYLWLSGRDPLILNPPPHWPVFPSSLHLASSGLVVASHRVPLHRSLPPADRLLLLGLPASDRHHSLDPGVAMVRTQADITRESQVLTPFLGNLEAEGLIDSYQFLPSAAAVWVRGTASAAQLEALPGVASLSGVKPSDVHDAEDGLSHAIVAQAAPQQAPSLWPVGFRSALHAWRPVTAVTSGQPFVTGVALPGQSVRVRLLRNGRVLARGGAVADPESGAFVALLAAGTAIGIPEAGDTVEVRTSGRTMRIPVLPVTVRSRPDGVAGVAPPGATVEVNVLDQRGGEVWKTLAMAGPGGTYAVKPPRLLSAGTLAVASLVDAAGDQVATSSFTPGFLLREGGSVIRGWTVGRHPIFWLRRGGRTVYEAHVHPAANGSFQLAMTSKGMPLVAEQGDVAMLGSVRHHHYAPLAGQPTTRHGRPVDASRSWILGIDQRQDVMVDPVGDIVQGRQPQRMDVVLDTARVVANVGAGKSATIDVYGPGGHQVAAADATAGGSGQFTASVRDWLGRPLTIRPGMTLALVSERGTSDVVIPDVRVSASAASAAVNLHAPASTSATLDFTGAGGRKERERVTLRSGSGAATVPLDMQVGRLRAVVLRFHLAPGFTIERALTFNRAASARK